MEAKQKIALTGDRPTGPLHIGHYFGSLINRKKIENDYQLFIMQADVQALTDNWDDTQKVRNAVYEVAADNLAMGIDTKKTTLFIQSQIPQIAELTVFFSNLITINRLQRNPTVKTEVAEKTAKFGSDGESVTFGFLGYPISQAADILFAKSQVIPVGQDQLPMIELCREIANKFNKTYNSKIFPKPEALLSQGTRILGLDGNAKMSKSLNNAIYLRDTEEITLKKIKSAKTDSHTEIQYDPTNRPEVSNLLQLFALTNNITIEQAESDLKNVRYGDFKVKLGQSINTYFKDFRIKREEIINNPKKIKKILEEGKQRALAKAEKTMQEVREVMGINY